jgi:transcriptional regulator GlxA family with amidase domain
MSVMNVALATGFVSASHFSKSYRLHFGYAPSEEKRSQMQAVPESVASVA